MSEFSQSVEPLRVLHVSHHYEILWLQQAAQTVTSLMNACPAQLYSCSDRPQPYPQKCFRARGCLASLRPYCMSELSGLRLLVIGTFATIHKPTRAPDLVQARGPLVAPTVQYIRYVYDWMQLSAMALRKIRHSPGKHLIKSRGGSTREFGP